ncbi:MAG: hypothetical protein EXX96DRAFT_483007 [Benjaminiella poitrasii]|nr:MAG: hypothetical protein EXX96DRAFT_483007 [Benjaminiella poitrasii]
MKGSPSSISSAGYGSPRTPPSVPLNHTNKNELSTVVSSNGHQQRTLLVNPLVPPSTTDVFEQQSTEDRVRETIARANTVPAEFYQTEFLEYSKSNYENQMSKKRKRTGNEENTYSNKRVNNDNQSYSYSEEEQQLSTSEIRRQIHIQSEQKRRAQIKDGFEVLKKHLPCCANKKLSKAALLSRAVQQLEHMKKLQDDLLAEVERLAKENSNLKK